MRVVRPRRRARAGVHVGRGLLYGALGIYGWFTDGLFLGTPFAVPLGAAESVFHLVLGVPALAILAREARGNR